MRCECGSLCLNSLHLKRFGGPLRGSWICVGTAFYIGLEKANRGHLRTRYHSAGDIEWNATKGVT